jgi:hypothetical protein
MSDDIIANSRELAATSRDLLVEFLRIELKIAHAMLDASNTSHEEATRERRRGRAREACAEVSRWLDAALPLGRLTEAERDELAAGLAGAHERLAVFGWRM